MQVGNNDALHPPNQHPPSDETVIVDVEDRSQWALKRLPSNVTIDGLYFDPDIQISVSTALGLLREIKERDYFRSGTVNQIMLFERSQENGTTLERDMLPPMLRNLLSELSVLLKDKIPLSTHQLLFPVASPETRVPARQAIMNLYRPGEGITPHVDLLRRFGDGIIIVSLGTGTCMQLAHLDGPTKVNLWLEPRSILILERDARYRWTHGIPARTKDLVEDEDFDDAVWIDRSARVSITLRWLLPGAEIVGEASDVSNRA